MGETKRHARRVARELADDGAHAIAVPRAKETVEEAAELTAAWADHVRHGFEREGWARSAGLYYRPDELSAETAELSRELRAAGRPVVARGRVSQRLVGRDAPDGEWGAAIDAALERRGWEIDEENGLYYLPVTELATESSLAYYLLGSFELA